MNGEDMRRILRRDETEVDCQTEVQLELCR